MLAQISRVRQNRPSVLSRQKDLQWFVKQFTEELKNKWNEFTFEMVLAIAEENVNIRRE